MSSLVRFSRLFPFLYPGIFPAAAAPPQDGPAAASSLAATVPVEAEADPSRSLKARRLKSLYQRTLRNQGNSEALTYSGLLSA